MFLIRIHIKSWCLWRQCSAALNSKDQPLRVNQDLSSTGAHGWEETLSINSHTIFHILQISNLKHVCIYTRVCVNFCIKDWTKHLWLISISFWNPRSIYLNKRWYFIYLFIYFRYVYLTPIRRPTGRSPPSAKVVGYLPNVCHQQGISPLRSFVF